MSDLWVPILTEYLRCPWKACMYQNTTQVITGGTAANAAPPNIVAFDSMYYDPTGSCVLGTNARYVAPVGGHYLVIGNWTFGSASATTGEFWGSVCKNGTEYAQGTHLVTASSTVFPQVTCTTLVPLAVGDYVDFRVGTNAGSGTTLTSTSGNIQRSGFFVHWMAPR